MKRVMELYGKSENICQPGTNFDISDHCTNHPLFLSVFLRGQIRIPKGCWQGGGGQMKRHSRIGMNMQFGVPSLRAFTDMLFFS